MSDSRLVKKVKPYPFDAVLTVGAQAIPGHVLKLTQTGLMVETPAFLKAGEKYNISFLTPVLKAQVSAHLVCVRTWDQYASQVAAGAGSHKLAELHFHELDSLSREHIVQFLRKIGQIK